MAMVSGHAHSVNRSKLTTVQHNRLFYSLYIILDDWMSNTDFQDEKKNTIVIEDQFLKLSFIV